MNNVKGFALLISALVLCPCHLPILAAVFAGTALGWTITDHYGLLFPAMALYFVGALFLGVRWMTREADPACSACEVPSSVDSQEHDGKRAAAPHGNGADRTPVQVRAEGNVR